MSKLNCHCVKCDCSKLDTNYRQIMILCFEIDWLCVETDFRFFEYVIF